MQNDDEKIRVPVTGMEPAGDVKWCVTRGWGNTNEMMTKWNDSTDFESAVQKIAAYAKEMHPKSLREVWTYSFMPDGSGVVCDFGDYKYFGFVKGGCQLQVPAPTPEDQKPQTGRPKEECTAGEYLDSSDGRILSSHFNGYTRRCGCQGASWWQAHALEYCLVSEWWTMFCEDGPSIREIWDRDMSPDDIYGRVLKWSSEDPDGAEILLAAQTDSRWDAFHRALTWGED